MSFDWTRDVPPEWQADLNRLNPGERVTSLHLAWLAGWPYEPVQRWAIYEVTSAQQVQKILEQERAAGAKNSFLSGLWKDLQGADPRTLGKWVPDQNVEGGKRWVSKSTVSRTQWDLHKKTGGLPLLCWIIEGVNGGHAWQFGPFERHFLLAVGTPPELIQAMAEKWPNPGDRAYAPYDQRVFKALAERDLLGQWREGMAWEDRADRTRAGLIVDGLSTARHQQNADRMMRWLDNQISDAVSDIPRKLLPQWSEFATVGEGIDADSIVHDYRREV